MKRVELVTTKDGSRTLKNLKTGENYHSIHGAITESNHVFIKNGLESLPHRPKEIRILEVGFGSGLNFFLSLDWAEKNEQIINYTSLEPYPLTKATLIAFFRDTAFSDRLQSILPNYDEKSGCIWSSPFCMLNVRICKLLELTKDLQFDLIYFDAFSPSTQEEMWTEESLSIVVDSMRTGAYFTTYCARGYVRRSLEALGLTVERREGPPGKREMIVAHK